MKSFSEYLRLKSPQPLLFIWRIIQANNTKSSTLLTHCEGIPVVPLDSPPQSPNDMERVWHELVNSETKITWGQRMNGPTHISYR